MGSPFKSSIFFFFLFVALFVLEIYVLYFYLPLSMLFFIEVEGKKHLIFMMSLNVYRHDRTDLVKFATNIFQKQLFLVKVSFEL